MSTDATAKRGRGRPKGSKSKEPNRPINVFNNDYERDKAKAKVMQMAVRDYPQTHIAEELGVSPSLICQWLKEMREGWKTHIREDKEELISQKRAQFEEVRREAWNEWEKSKNDIERRVVASGTKGDTDWTKEELITEGRLAAKAFLDVVMDTYRQERAMLGLDPEPKAASNSQTVNVGFNWVNILAEAAEAGDPIATLEMRINALAPEERAQLPPITADEVLAEELMQ